MIQFLPNPSQFGNLNSPVKGHFCLSISSPPLASLPQHDHPLISMDYFDGTTLHLLPYCHINDLPSEDLPATAPNSSVYFSNVLLSEHHYIFNFDHMYSLLDNTTEYQIANFGEWKTRINLISPPNISLYMVSDCIIMLKEHAPSNTVKPLLLLMFSTLRVQPR